jgi:hypothetical protein
MIRDPQNVSPTDATYRDPALDPKFEVREPIGTGSVVGAGLAVLLLVAGAIWAFGPPANTVATKSPITTTGQGSSETGPAPLPTVPAPVPTVPREKSGGDNNVVDVDQPPKR